MHDVVALDQRSDSGSDAGEALGLSDQAATETPRTAGPAPRWFDLVHAMRTRVITEPGLRRLPHPRRRSCSSRRWSGTCEGVPTARYLWDQKQVVPFLKVDKGLADEHNGVRLMKPIDTLDGLLERANRHRIFGTKMRSVIKDADKDGVTAIVDQQFEYAARISAAGLVPILEPEVSIDSPHKDEAETLLRDALQARIEALPDDAAVMLKLTIPTQPGLLRRPRRRPAGAAGARPVRRLAGRADRPQWTVVRRCGTASVPPGYFAGSASGRVGASVG